MVLPHEIRVAACTGDTAAIQDWFSSGTRDLDDRDQYGDTLLHWAAYKGRCDTMRFLLDHGASMDITINGGTPLSDAVSYGRHDAAVLLLDRGAQIDFRDRAGWTPLMRAADHGRCTMIRLLLSRGADLTLRSNAGRDAEAVARVGYGACDLLADVRLAGGWNAYLRYPRKRLLALRVLCERGRAKTDDGLLLRLFPWQAPVKEKQGPTTRAARRARAAWDAQLPKEVFWLILKFWRCDRDSRY